MTAEVLCWCRPGAPEIPVRSPHWKNPDCAGEPALVCSGCGATALTGTEGWRRTDAAWCPKCRWLA